MSIILPYMYLFLPIPVINCIVVILLEMKEIDDILHHLLNEYRWLLDSYVLDFFVERIWDKLLPSWREHFQSYQPSDWGIVLNKDPSPHILPLSFLCLRHIISQYSLSRRGVASPEEISDITGLPIIEDESSDIFPSISASQHLRIKIKKKKQHEIDRVVLLTKMLQIQTGFDTAVDIGAGLGHLSRLLAHSIPDIKVKTIEGDEKLVSSSSSLDNSMSRRMGSSFSAPIRSHDFINCSSEDTTLCDKPGSSALVLGLHPCGDLSPSLLRIFHSLPSSRCLLLLGCCYHKMTGCGEQSFQQKWMKEQIINTPLHPSFPMSNRYSHFCLSYSARELACHAKEMFIDSIQTKNESYSVNAYRALLEWMILKSGKDDEGLRHLGLKGVKNAHQMSFEEYAEKALIERTNIWKCVKDYMNENDEAKEAIKNLKQEANKVFGLYCIRLMLAPLVETIIVKDRCAYLDERSHINHVIPLFDPVISARNLAIVAWKNNTL